MAICAPRNCSCRPRSRRKTERPSSRARRSVSLAARSTRPKRPVESTRLRVARDRVAEGGESMASRLKSGACALVIAGALLSISAPAIAGETHQLSGDFAPFADCPLRNPAVALCMVAKITAGELVVGRRKVPIDKPLEIQAGLVETTRLNEYTFAAAEDGNTLSKTTLSIPGGLTGTNTPARA